MEINRETADYIVRYYSRLMTDAEKRAHRNLSLTMKATRGRSDLAAQGEIKRSTAHAKFMSADPEALALSKDGYEPFLFRTAARIMRENEDMIRFNRCPKCGNLARTPTARQCRMCRHDWHAAP